MTVMQSFVLPPNGAVTPESIRRRRKMAELLMDNAMSTAPVGHWLEGAARVAQAGIGGLAMRRADQQEAEGRAAFGKRMAAALMGQPDLSSLADLSADPYGQDNPMVTALIGEQFEKRKPHDSQWQYIQPQMDAWGNETVPGYWADVNAQQAPQTPQRTPLQYQSQSLPPGGMPMPAPSQLPGAANASPMLEENYYPGQPQPGISPGGGAAGSAPDMASLARQWLPGVSPKIIMGNPDIQEFLVSKATNPGDTRDFNTWDIQRRKSSATSVSVGGEGDADTKLRNKLSEKEGERWSALQEAGVTASNLQQQMQVLDELAKIAPQGALQGRLAQALPGFSTAGDAFGSIATSMAPTLRTPGSGSTSDIEYEGFLKGLPRLQNTEGGNQIISQVVQAKARLNIERASIITSYQNGEVSAAEARSMLNEINRQSILSPELKHLIEGAGANEGDGGWKTRPDGIRIRRKGY